MSTLHRVESWAQRARNRYRPGLSRVPASLLGDAEIRQLAKAISRPLTVGEQRWVRRIEAMRAELEARTDEVPERRHPPHTVGGIARKASQAPASAEVLMKLVRASRPRLGVELGTCVGVSAAYQCAPMALNQAGQLVTIEASRTLAQVAREALAGLGLRDSVEVRRGRFDELLPDLLDHAPDYAFVDGNHTEDATIRYFESFAEVARGRALLVFDDIEWSEGMRVAWSRIRTHPRTRWTTEVGRLGVCVTNG